MLKFIAPLINTAAFFRKLDIKLLYFIIPAFLSMGVAVFEGLSLGLLIPLIKGVIYQDFGFARGLPGFKNIIAVLPENLTKTDSFTLVLIIVMIFAAVVIKSVLQYFSSLGISYQIGKFTNNLRKAVFDRYLGFGKLFFDRGGSAYLNTLLNQFPAIISQALINCQYVITAIFTLCIYIIILFLISWQLTFAFLLVFPILHYSVRVLIEKIKETSKVQASWYIQINKKALDIIRGIALVKLYNREKEERKDFNNLSDTVKKVEFSMRKKSFLIMPLHEIITTSMILVLIIGVAFIMTVWKAHDISGFLLFFVIIRRSTMAIGSFNVLRSSVAQIKGPVGKLKEIFDDKDKSFVRGGNHQFPGLQNEIEFKDLNFSYIKGVEILKGINFTVKKGEMTALAGPTGVGKTTIINLLLRFYECPSSSIFLDGTDIKDYTLESFRSHMALVSQDTILFNDTIRNNIAYGFDSKVSDDILIDVVKKARLYDFIQGLPDGLDTLVGDMGVRLSGGEKQRVSVARALLKASEILILDEATSSLDTHTEKLIQQAIEEAVKGRTTIVIAHRLSTIKNADKIVVIENG
ncbi:MAG: ABC transporter ATP-binding protein, partial [Candidatus Omnitrophota bacterium]